MLAVFFVVPLAPHAGHQPLALSRTAKIEWAFTLQHYVHFFTDAYYLGVLGDTLWLGVITTAVALLLGYPLAYHLALTRSRLKPLRLSCSSSRRSSSAS